MKHGFDVVKLCCYLLFFLTNVGWSKEFANDFLRFDLPPSWDCRLEGAEWICQSNNESKKKEAMIVFAAKKRGPKDSLEAYQEYLKKEKTFTLPGGNTVVSSPKYIKPTSYSDHRWIDSLHLASEIPGFYTRYLASVKEDLAVVITFSVSKASYNIYAPVFDKMISGLRIYAQAKPSKVSLGSSGSSGHSGSAQTVAIGDDSFVAPAVSGKAIKADKSKSGGEDQSMLFLIFGVIALVGWVLMRKKK
jgi:hypothetical protein